MVSKPRKWKLKKWFGSSRKAGSKSSKTKGGGSGGSTDDVSREDGTLSASDEGSMKPTANSSVDGYVYSSPAASRASAKSFVLSWSPSPAASASAPASAPASASAPAPASAPSSPDVSSFSPPPTPSKTIEKARRLVETRNATLTTEFPHLPNEMKDFVAAKKVAQKQSEPRPRKTNIVVVSNASAASAKKTAPLRKISEHSSGVGTATLQKSLSRPSSVLPESFLASLFNCGELAASDSGDDVFSSGGGDDDSTLGLETTISHRIGAMENVFRCFREMEENDETVVDYGDGNESYTSLASYTVEGTIEGTVEGTIEGTVEGTIEGTVDDTVEGTLDGEDQEGEHDDDDDYDDDEDETSHYTDTDDSDLDEDRGRGTSYIARKVLNPNAPPSTIAVLKRKKVTTAPAYSDPTPEDVTPAPPSPPITSRQRQQGVDSTPRTRSSTRKDRLSQASNLAVENSRIEVIRREAPKADNLKLARWLNDDVETITSNTDDGRDEQLRALINQKKTSSMLSTDTLRSRTGSGQSFPMARTLSRSRQRDPKSYLWEEKDLYSLTESTESGIEAGVVGFETSATSPPFLKIRTLE